MNNFTQKEHYTYEDLFRLIRLLRAPDGCPWDRVQTHRSVRRGVIEEAYEVAEAIDEGNREMMVEELGDLMMQVLFHICIGEEEQEFTAQDVYDRVCKKLIFRHPRLFGDATDDRGSTEEGWEELKRKEKGQKSLAEELDGIAKSLPSLTRAEKMAGKIHGKEDPLIPLSLLKEQAARLEQKPTADELGELLFTAARLAKSLKIDPEEALYRKNQEKLGQKY